MTPAARAQAAIVVLDEILAGKPAEQALTGWARRSRFAGSKDRAAVRDHVFGALRCRRSYAALGGAETGRGLILGSLRDSGLAPETLFDGSTYGPPPVEENEIGRSPAEGAEAGDLPDWLWPEFERSLGAGATSGAEYLRQRAPVFIRANRVRVARSELLALLGEEGIQTTPHIGAQTALEVIDGARQLRNSAAFRQGLFEFQDVTSQAVVEALPLNDGARVIDYCAGGGGKTLAMGACAQVNLFAHDIDARRMRDLPERAARATLDVTVLEPGKTEFDGGYDLVLCDAPCSGSGSWRRAPDGKWNLTPERLNELTVTQDAILEDASELVSPSGILAYATCSVLNCENEDRVAGFIQRHANWHIVTQKRWPLSGGGDGFFCALLTRK